MQAELSISREDYLKAIIEAESEGHAVVPVLLSHWLGVSPPAVTKAIRRLREDGFLEDAPGGTLQLTRAGRQVAHRTAFRHHLVERMLSEIFGMEWHHVHAEAERLEHVISPEFEAKLIEKLGNDGDCPHGNPVLPESPAQIRRRGLIALTEAQPGVLYTVASLYERDDRLLSFLHRLGIGPQSTLQLLERNYDNTLRLRVAEAEVTLGASAAERVYIRALRRTEPG